MFKNILNEIHRQKKLMNLIKEDKDIKSVIFGDDIIDYLNKNNFEEIPQLTGKFLKLKDLISNLKNIDVKPEVDHVFFSIGKNDKFENEDLIDILSQEHLQVQEISRHHKIIMFVYLMPNLPQHHNQLAHLPQHQQQHHIH
jgi:hypothetical protein